MQKGLFLVCLGLGLFFTQNSWSQYYNNGYGNNGYGNNGRMGQMNQMSQLPSQQSAPKPPSNDETASKVMERLKPELSLDALQEIAVKNILIESLNAQGVIIKKETSNESKGEDLKVISENTDRKILELLNPDQKEIYKKISSEGFKKKKKK
ncbi:hypothetical protein BXU11_06815 [Flavobacterium sp. LM5]|uniref:hypothetical protein n=1 Tax=Flavobacterium sp. LM5 TaxID=1938610 RepID=UPI0009947E6A|nr:hypothetical protein [Flavobacterium sp. LM5]OOV29587.1 hypothetical protein BXU11_06815 [Flavobacterium sp. LM5]